MFRLECVNFPFIIECISHSDNCFSYNAYETYVINLRISVSSMNRSSHQVLTWRLLHKRNKQRRRLGYLKKITHANSSLINKESRYAATAASALCFRLTGGHRWRQNKFQCASFYAERLLFAWMRTIYILRCL